MTPLIPFAAPLAWPGPQPRTPAARRRAGRFGARARLTHHAARARVSAELRLLERFGARSGDASIATMMRVRQDGGIYARETAPSDPGAVLRFRWATADSVLAIDEYDDVVQNVAAIAACLEALRTLERHGGASVLDRAMSGLAALPAPGTLGERSWRQVLGGYAGHDLAVLDGIRRRLLSRYHPDTGLEPDPDLFHDVTRAWSDARRELGGRVAA